MIPVRSWRCSQPCQGRETAGPAPPGAAQPGGGGAGRGEGTRQRGGEAGAGGSACTFCRGLQDPRERGKRFSLRGDKRIGMFENFPLNPHNVTHPAGWVEAAVWTVLSPDALYRRGPGVQSRGPAAGPRPGLELRCSRPIQALGRLVAASSSWQLLALLGPAWLDPLLPWQPSTRLPLQKRGERVLEL